MAYDSLPGFVLYRNMLLCDDYETSHKSVVYKSLPSLSISVTCNFLHLSLY
jgi:hypothetical protein